ncbi:MAG: hypothetical protein ACP5VF_03870 [Acidobacteriota bacterium]
MSAMTITFSLRDVFLFVLGLVCLGVLAYFLAVLRKLSLLLDDWRRLASRAEGIAPRIERVLESADGTLAAARRVVEGSEGVVKDLAAVSSSVRDVAQATVAQVATVLAPVRYLAALVTGLRKTLESLLLGTDHDGHDDKEDSDEERDI